MGMIEKAALRTAKTLYALAIGAGVIWLAWLCLAHLPLWAAVVVFCIGLPLLASVAAPIAAGGAWLAGLAVGLAAFIGRSLYRRVRSAG
ncbi:MULTISPECIES: hypothetical protein [unclassified Pseudomonas]|uniref:hypothetical protein n=1 Tax=unclassified Pseudomonas TaxID=196821 RepID=UPI001FAF5D74|nr:MULTISPECIES: hypothetical protein [unclassified Pseudomonas]